MLQTANKELIPKKEEDPKKTAEKKQKAADKAGHEVHCHLQIIAFVCPQGLLAHFTELPPVSWPNTFTKV